MSVLQTNPLTGQNLSTELLLSTYTADKDYDAIKINNFVDGLVGTGGDYIIRASIQKSGAGTEYFSEKTTLTLASGEVDRWVSTIVLEIESGDIVKVYLTGLAGDNTSSVDIITNWSAQVQQSDILSDATPFAGADIASIVSSLSSLVANVWSAAKRTLTQSAASVVSAVVGDNISDVRGNTWAISLTLDYDITDLKVQIALKEATKDTDAESIEFIDTDTGLLVINGVAATVSENSKASITVVDAVTGSIIWNVDADVTASHEFKNKLFYGIQVIDPATDPDEVLEKWGGTFLPTHDVIRVTE